MGASSKGAATWGKVGALGVALRFRTLGTHLKDKS